MTWRQVVTNLFSSEGHLVMLWVLLQQVFVVQRLSHLSNTQKVPGSIPGENSFPTWSNGQDIWLSPRGPGFNSRRGNPFSIAEQATFQSWGPTHVQGLLCIYFSLVLTLRPPWRNRLARSAVNRKVGGSSPPGGEQLFMTIYSFIKIKSNSMTLMKRNLHRISFLFFMLYFLFLQFYYILFNQNPQHITT